MTTTAGAEASFDGWSAPADLGLPPIRVVADSGEQREGHRLRLDVPELAVGGILDDLARSRGYTDGKSQGGGLSLFLGGLPMVLTLRWLDGQPVPDLHPGQTRCRLNANGNLTLVELTRQPHCDHPDVEGLAARIVAVMAPCFSAIRLRTGFSVVNQWAQFTSGLLDLLLTSELLSDAEAVGFVDELTGAHPVLRRARPRLGSAVWQGQARPYAVRRVCCFNYRGTSGSYCGSLCPLVDPAERDRDAQLAWAG